MVNRLQAPSVTLIKSIPVVSVVVTHRRSSWVFNKVTLRAFKLSSSISNQAHHVIANGSHVMIWNLTIV